MGDGNLKEFLVDMTRIDLENLAYCLLKKREIDGLNGRTWDATRHLIWEKEIVERLKKLNEKSQSQTTFTSLILKGIFS